MIAEIKRKFRSQSILKLIGIIVNISLAIAAIITTYFEFRNNGLTLVFWLLCGFTIATVVTTVILWLCLLPDHEVQVVRAAGVILAILLLLVAMVIIGIAAFTDLFYQHPPDIPPPTYTLLPTLTSYPTNTPYPTYTRMPISAAPATYPPPDNLVERFRFETSASKWENIYVWDADWGYLRTDENAAVLPNDPQERGVAYKLQLNEGVFSNFSVEYKDSLRADVIAAQFYLPNVPSVEENWVGIAVFNEPVNKKKGKIDPRLAATTASIPPGEWTEIVLDLRDKYDSTGVLLNTRALYLQILFSLKGRDPLNPSTVLVRLDDIVWYIDTGKIEPTLPPTSLSVLTVTKTLTSTQITSPSPAPTIIPTLLPRPISTFTSTPGYPPPVLDGIDIIRCNVTLRWGWPRTLAADEWFAVRVGIGEPGDSDTWVKEDKYTHTLSDEGEYVWEVAVCRGDPGSKKCEQLAISEREKFLFGGCPIPTVPNPTFTRPPLTPGT